MTLRQKYQQFNNHVSVKEMVLTSVYNTMKLEGQTVSKERLEELYQQVQKERDLTEKLPHTG